MISVLTTGNRQPTTDKTLFSEEDSRRISQFKKELDELKKKGFSHEVFVFIRG